jgi:hypothetical protein
MEVRDLFARALEEPDVEKEVLLHTSQCLECMDAFLELKDIVKRLNHASAALPESGTFAAAVFAGIEKESKRRGKKSQLILSGGAGLAVGLAIMVVYLIASGYGTAPTPIRAKGAEDGTHMTWPEPKLPANPVRAEPEEKVQKPENPPQPPSTEPAPEEPEKEPVPPEPGEKPKPDRVGRLLLDYLALEKERPFGPGPARGRRKKGMKTWIDRLRKLTPGELDDLVSRLKKAPKPDHYGAQRMRSEILNRLNIFRDKGFPPFRPSRPPRKKKN